jgi:comEA protein
MNFIQRLFPFVAVFMLMCSINATAVPNKAEQSGASSTEVVNINTATVEQLETLTGIGESKAKAIIAYREDKEKFNSVEDLTKVKGISDNTVATLVKKNPNRIIAK